MTIKSVDVAERKMCGVEIFLKMLIYFFFFNDTATTEIYTLSLHDALPIYSESGDLTYAGILKDGSGGVDGIFRANSILISPDDKHIYVSSLYDSRSEEHTSELQSHSFISYAVFCLKKKNFSFFPLFFFNDPSH